MEYLILSTILLLGDAGQTRACVVDPNCTETNILLPKNPSLKQVNIYFGGVIALNAGITYLLPKKHKVNFGKVVSGYELLFNLKNRSAGIGFNFKYK